MPSVVETPGVGPTWPGLGFSVAHQKLELEVDFRSKSLKGKTEITIHPHYKDLKVIKLNFRQGELKRLNVCGKAATTKYSDPCASLNLYGVQYYQRLADKLEPFLQPQREPELYITIPKSVRIEELDPFSIEAQNQVALRSIGNSDDPDIATTRTETSQPRFTALTVYIEFTVDNIREGLQFVGVDSGDRRYPHVYTTNATGLGAGSSLFPCVDDPLSRCTWEISIRCPCSLSDVFGARSTDGALSSAEGTAKSAMNGVRPSGLSADDDTLDMSVVCSGDMTDEIVDPRDPSKKTVSFACAANLSAQQIGFAVGPFEYVNLSEFRESDQDDQLGQNAVPVHAFCLPGRAEDVRNTCFPMARAVDYFSMTYGSYPFSSCKFCFVDDAPQDTTVTASLSICSNHVLFPTDIIDPLYESTRTLVHTVASQWIGMNLIPKEPADTWVIVGMAYYITDTFMRKLCGNNEYRFRMKQMSDRVCDMDYERPSIYDMGNYLKLDPSELEFIELKAPLVLFILERRLAKASGKPTMSRIISRLLLNARMGDLANGAVTTSYFIRTCEKIGHAKLDVFFNQWVYGAGCPRFTATQRFNKKKLVVEIMIKQVQGENQPPRNLEKQNFMRDVKEEIRSVYAGAVQPVFTGSMTIRIHEADGTPYEHIVEIKEGVTKLDIPYNTKYKRLKRSKRQRERAVAASGGDSNQELENDVLLYCLGDVLQSDEEMREWRLADWSKEEEERMGQESYEWIRMDADFEWICKLSLAMPGYMYLSQLQQDRDVVAQLESMQYMAVQRPHPLVSTILVRTLMDRRYFHGIRVMAAQALVKHAKEEINWLGLFHLEKAFQELFCLPGSHVTRANDFSDRASYILQKVIPDAVSQIRDNSGKTPMRAKQFIYEKLKFNDNSENEYSDNFYIASLMTSMCNALEGRVESSSQPDDIDFDVQREMERQAEEKLERDAIAEIDRYRRMDEWSTSYQNIYTRTAIRCQLRLHRAKLIDVDAMHFLQYTRPGTYDKLRLEAFECLVELDLFRNPNLLRWFIYNMSADPSPWMRSQLHRLFGRALAPVAFGTDQAPEQPVQTDGLIIEQESTTDVRRADLARKQTVPGALAALKEELKDNETLQECLWAAANSSYLGPLEVLEFVDLCRILYDSKSSLLVQLKYPRYWKAEHLGNGKMRFYRSSRLRTSLHPTKDATAAAAGSKRKRDEQAMPPPAPRITFKSSKLSGSTASPSPHSNTITKLQIPKHITLPPPSAPTATPTTTTPGTPGTPGGGFKLKLKFGNQNK